MIKEYELRKEFLDYFKKQGHAVLPSASLLPENDPSVLFTTAGMQPLAPYLLGEKHPAGTKLVNYQKCVRTGDIDEVGDNWHLTFFEMLGNWSLGDYWKEKAIDMSWNFLTSKEYLGLDKKKLAVSVYKDSQTKEYDQESYLLWKSRIINEKRIAFLGKEDNWWPAGEKSSGPQGPDTEMFYWTGNEEPPVEFDPTNKKWCEIWNDVFMEYNRAPDGKLQFLRQKNVDTGMGLERTVAVLNGKNSVYETGIFQPILREIQRHTLKSNQKAERIIADHLRTACFILAEGVTPSNVEQGYVLRRLIRRAIRQGKTMEARNGFIKDTAKVIIDLNIETYPELEKNEKFILSEMDKEDMAFTKTLDNGLKELNKIVKEKKEELLTLSNGVNFSSKSKDFINVISGKDAFYIYQTYGLPLELINEELKNCAMFVDKKEFNEEFEREFKKHKEVSHAGAEQKFKGGLIDHSQETVKLHTATHLLHAALKNVLGGHVAQKGSNITTERLRFDFTHPEKVTPEKLKIVEDMINEQIKKDLPVKLKEVTTDEAKKEGAIGLFEQKYSDKVKVYSIGDFSKEICGGPHVKHIGELGQFNIIKEEAVAKGIRRIKAILVK